jgi:hypothetical protein
MRTLTERRIAEFVQQAQFSLYVHERDTVYPEILELVDEMVDLLVEVRRDRAALEAIAARREEALVAARSGTPGADLALRMCGTARVALGLGEPTLAPTSSPAREPPGEVLPMVH